MIAFLLLGAIAFELVACFALSEGGAMPISHEVTAYANEKLTLSCKPRDSPSHLVFWYKIDRNNKEVEKFQYTGPTFTIANASVTDTGIYSCSAAEWGTWGIKSYIIVNVIVPGEQSCADGWELHKTSCYMYSAPKVIKSWQAAEAYCKGSKAQLVHPKNREDLLFLKNLAKNRSESMFWTALQRSSYGNFRRRPGREAPQCNVFNKKRRTLGSTDCSKALPFICERALPTVPKDVSIEHITSSMARIGWSVGTSTSSDSPKAYHIELTTSDLNVVSRIPSGGSSVTFTHLQPNTRYQVRVQAENAAGNGSSSSFVAFRTKPRPPTIVCSAPNAKVIGGQSMTLKCSYSHGNISWYKDGSDVPIGHGKVLTIRSASPNDEGTYHCAAENGLRGSLKVLVIVPPVISDIKVILLQQQQQNEDKNKQELILLCETANRHPVEYSWMKNGTPLTTEADMVKVSLQGNNTVPWQYECHVTNLAGTASRSLAINPIGKTVDVKESGHPEISTSPYLVSAIAVVSVLLALVCFACVARKKIAKLVLKKKSTRKLTAQSTSTVMTPVEFSLSEHRDSPPPASRSSVNVTQDNDDVFPYEVSNAWGGNGPYMSLRRREDNGEYEQDVTQVRKPDYFNISPSNRNDSAANCMYAPLKYTQGGGETRSRPYANIDGPGTCDM